MLVITDHLQKLEFEFQHLKREEIKPRKSKDENASDCNASARSRHRALLLERGKYLRNITDVIKQRNRYWPAQLQWFYSSVGSVTIARKHWIPAYQSPWTVQNNNWSFERQIHGPSTWNSPKRDAKPNWINQWNIARSVPIIGGKVVFLQVKRRSTFVTRIQFMSIKLTMWCVWRLEAMTVHIAARAYPGFCSMKRLGVILLPLDGMLVHRRSNPTPTPQFVKADLHGTTS